MTSAVLDTNVLASGTLTASTPPGQILDAWQGGQFELITSPYIIAELERTLQKPYFQKHLTTTATTNFLSLLKTKATVISPLEVAKGTATHPEDDPVLATAISAEADYLVTGDGPLLRKVGGSYRGVKLCTPSEFVEIIGF